jgi:hypothetical protein
MAYDGVRSLFTGTITGSWTVGHYATGGTSGAVGIVRAVTANTITIENIYGIFVAGETATSSANLPTPSVPGTVEAGISALLTTITQQSFVEMYPDIASAAEMQVRYELDHRFDIEATGMGKESGGYRSYRDMQDATSLLPVVMHDLDPYRNKAENAMFFKDYQG